MTITTQDGATGAVSTTRTRSRTEWTLLSNHGYVLLCIADDPDTRLRDIAARVGITERAVFGIVEDLERGGIIQRIKVGRRNRYLINVESPLRHEIEAGHSVGDLLGALIVNDADLA
ncbi:MAG: hypothetical protein JWN39_1537 [Ilumatobacteraceae bacterium]|nr:hypothetical protein [Ilumatobacteraceae bacterium]